MSRSRGIHPGLLGGRSVGVDRAADPVRAVSILQTVLLYGAVRWRCTADRPAGGRARLSRRPRYRPGDQWPYPSSWWSANPEGSACLKPSADGSAWCPSRLTDDGQMRSRSAPVEPDVIVPPGQRGHRGEGSSPRAVQGSGRTLKHRMLSSSPGAERGVLPPEASPSRVPRPPLAASSATSGGRGPLVSRQHSDRGRWARGHGSRSDDQFGRNRHDHHPSAVSAPSPTHHQRVITNTPQPDYTEALGRQQRFEAHGIPRRSLQPVETATMLAKPF